MELSQFGEKFTSKSGILQLMDDLGNALSVNKEMLMLGGGNPAHIPEVQRHFRHRMRAILQNGDEFERMIGNYDPPKGEVGFISALAELLRKTLGWEIYPDNIALTTGSQASFFILFNMFAGQFEDGRAKKILLPMAPEYIGYADIGLTTDFFATWRPTVEHLDKHTFKYHVNFNEIIITDEIGAMCLSRPTNPTGNVLTDEELDHLVDLAQAHKIPIIIDNAYGAPFPNIIFTEAKPLWTEHTIFCMSLSKVGLPGARTGIVIARPDIIDAVSRINAVLNLATSSLGAALALDLVRSGELINISKGVITPYYEKKAQQAIAWFSKELDGCDYHIHKAEGAIFLWLWFRELPITSEQLYERLKSRGVLVVSGHYFFPGLKDDWRHCHECLRVTYSQDAKIVERGVRIIAEEVKKAYTDR